MTEFKPLTDPECIKRVRAVRDRAMARLVASLGQEEAERSVSDAKKRMIIWENNNYKGRP
jgi:hypothetical protein